MEKIKSFQVDHRVLTKGIYVSRIDGDVVTYDLRFCHPNTGVLLDNSSIHTVEHMLATYLRNSEIKDDIVYFGPMGCQTGFYMLIRDRVGYNTVLEVLKDVLNKTIEYNGEVFGASEIECGNYKNLDLEKAKIACKEYLAIIRDTTEIIDYDEVNKRVESQ